MRNIEIKEVTTPKDFRHFINLSWDVFRNDSNWVPPLRIERKDFFSPKNPFFKTARIKKWLAIEQGKVKGRIVSVINETHNQFHDEKCCFWGCFETIDDQEIAHKLFEAVESHAKQEGMTLLRGPMNLSTNQDCGLLVKGFDDPPQIMMPYNHPYFEKLIMNENHQKAMDLYAWIMPTSITMPEKIVRISERLEKSNGITYRILEKKNWNKEIELMFQIYNDAWERNWGFIPMDHDEWLHTCEGLKLIADPELIIFVEVHGEAVGFLVALPDYNQVFKKIPNGKLLPWGIFKLLRAKKYINRMRIITMGVKKKYHNLGLATLLYTEIKKRVCAKNPIHFKEVEMSWVLETNLQMNRPLELMGASIYKTYRIFEKKLI